MKREMRRKEIISENIKNYLLLNGLHQNEAARLAGINPQTVNNWIKERSYPREDLLAKLAAAFNVSPSAITEDQSRTALRQNYYMSAWQRSVTDRCENDPIFREYVDFGLNTEEPERLIAYVELLKKSGKA